MALRNISHILTHELQQNKQPMSVLTHHQDIFVEGVGMVSLKLTFHQHEEDCVSNVFPPRKYWICESPAEWDQKKYTPEQNQAIQKAIDQETFTYDPKDHEHLDWRI